MFKIIQEAALPKLSQTSLFIKFNEKSNIMADVGSEISNAKDHIVKPTDIPEILSLMKLNGDAVVKRAIASFEKNEIVVINNKETSKIPASLPFIVATKGSEIKAYVFANKVVNNINSPQEYTNLMAVLEAAYLSLQLQKKPNLFLMNRPMILILCTLYERMVTLPLVQKLYMRGDNLTKSRLYIIAYFYRMIDGTNIDNIPYKRIISDKIDDAVVKQVIEDVKALPDTSFMSLIQLIKKLNPVRYKDLDVLYLTHFTSSCGVSLIFALENLAYLFILIASANYKTQITAYGLNKSVGLITKKAITTINSMSM